MEEPCWIAVDWGTSRLRVWFMSNQDEVIASRVSDKGMGRLNPDDFEGALLELIAERLPIDGRTRVVCCGMVGAAQGWQEATYKSVPCQPPGAALSTRPAVCDPRLDVMILPGISQNEPPDVMRGEETQIQGFLAQTPGYSGCICLPGTHTKWVNISHGRIDRFQTCMTGEVFSLLADQSVLRHSIIGSGIDQLAFGKAVELAASNPSMLPTELFRIRAAGLLGIADLNAARGHLSGLLIGAELIAAKDYWRHNAVRLIGESELSRHYRNALGIIGGDALLVDAADLTLKGLIAAYREHIE